MPIDDKIYKKAPDTREIRDQPVQMFPIKIAKDLEFLHTASKDSDQSVQNESSLDTQDFLKVLSQPDFNENGYTCKGDKLVKVASLSLVNIGLL